MPATGPLVRAGREPLAPLRRRPKQLTTPPVVLQSSGTGAGLALTPTARRPGEAHGPTGAQPGTSEDVGQVGQQWPTVQPDPAVRAAALATAARFRLPRPRRAYRPRPGPGVLDTVAYSGGAAEVDLDRTLERLVAHPVLRAQDVLVRERVRRKRAVVLCVDLSGSMRGTRVQTTAAAVAGFAAELSRDDLGLVAFWSDAAVLLGLGRPVRPMVLVDALLRLPAEGLTNVALPLEVAARQLEGCTARDARVVLLSDCVHNAGPDPRALARRLPRLDVLLDRTGEHDRDLAKDLARLGRGRLAVLDGPAGLPSAVRTLFSR